MYFVSFFTFYKWYRTNFIKGILLESPLPKKKTTTKNMRNEYLSPLPYINNINYFKKMMSIFLTVSNTNYILR